MLHVHHRLAGNRTQCFIYLDPETQSDRAASVSIEAVTAEGKKDHSEAHTDSQSSYLEGLPITSVHILLNKMSQKALPELNWDEKV